MRVSSTQNFAKGTLAFQSVMSSVAGGPSQSVALLAGSALSKQNVAGGFPPSADWESSKQNIARVKLPTPTGCNVILVCTYTTDFSKQVHS